MLAPPTKRAHRIALVRVTVGSEGLQEATCRPPIPRTHRSKQSSVDIRVIDRAAGADIADEAVDCSLNEVHCGVDDVANLGSGPRVELARGAASEVAFELNRVEELCDAHESCPGQGLLVAIAHKGRTNQLLHALRHTREGDLRRGLQGARAMGEGLEHVA